PDARTGSGGDRGCQSRRLLVQVRRGRSPPPPARARGGVRCQSGCPRRLRGATAIPQEAAPVGDLQRQAARDTGQAHRTDGRTAGRAEWRARFGLTDPPVKIGVTTDAGWSSLVARRAHNPKVGGSNPPPATKDPSEITRTGLSRSGECGGRRAEWCTAGRARGDETPIRAEKGAAQPPR